NEVLEHYVGTYSRSDINGWNIIITKDGDMLKISGDGLALMDIFPYAEDKFFIKGFGFRYEFIKDETNKIIKMNIFDKDKLLLDAKKIN
ncbi:MAG: hypothetical protein Q8R79_03980, partial [Legionellaceae bacterium]|nr:hypothetical protein [Legionellaceae bacterium]